MSEGGVDVKIVVEGQTEEMFVGDVLAPHLHHHHIHTTTFVVKTKQDRGTGHTLAKGGGSWGRWRKTIRNSLNDRRRTLRVTTLFDLYGLPKDFPDLAACETERDTRRRAELLEKAMADDIGDRRFLPYIQRHEFEALVLAGLPRLREYLGDDAARRGLDALQREIGDTSPEDVNDGKETAPSKRILTHIRTYQKIIHGVIVTSDVGVEGLKKSCPRFGAWVTRLETLGGERP